ncbi:MAG TPA: ATP-binding protein, partial [Acidimicrobiia bacterium]|nr:ATP-binding protein [Acidimicrobiia bacterium]
MHRIIPHRSAVVVVLVGAVVAGVAFGTSQRVTESDERAILEREARLTATAMQSLVGSTKSSLEAAVAVATIRDGDPSAFEQFAASSGLEFYRSVTLFRMDADGWNAAMTVGDLADAVDPDLLGRIGKVTPGEFSLTGYRGDGLLRALGVAMRSESQPDAMVYGEIPMPAGVGIGNGDEFVQGGDSPFALDFALYIEREADDQIAFSSSRELPFPGPRAVVTFGLDDREGSARVDLDTEPGEAAGQPHELVLVTAPRTPLTSALSRSLPWLLALAALAGALPIAGLVELVSRRRDRALHLVDELEAAECRIVADQARFHDIISGAPDAMFSVDPVADELVILNRDDVFGYSAEELRGGAGIELLIHPDDAPTLTGIGEELSRAGEEVVEAEVRVRPKHGDQEWVRFRVKALARDEFSTPTQVLVTCTVVTREHAADEERRALETRLRQSQRMEAVGQLAGGIAHDFNNLLAVILSYASFAAEDLDGHPAQEDLEEVISAARRAADLTGQLLTFSRRQIVEPTILDLNSVVADMHRILQRTLAENIAFESRLEDTLPMVHADPGELEQILMNLAVNARDAIDGHDGALVIETTTVDIDEEYAANVPDAVPGRHVRLSVSDTGDGMAPAVAAMAFEPFFTTKEPGKGTGMGLATVYGIVRRWGGHVTLYSEPGEGTVVRAYFPAVEGILPT